MTVYILEDEINILKHLMALVDEIPYLQVVGYAGDIAKAQTEIPALQPELILADIQLKDGNSFTLFSRIDVSSSQIIFITAYDQYALQALNLGAFAYLLKPIETAALNEATDRCFKKSEQQKFNQHQLEIAATHYKGGSKPRRIALRSAEYTQIIDIEDILYCKSDRGYTTFYLKNGSSILVSKVLKEYEALLPEETFVRCHQSYLVNGNYVTRYYKDGYLEITNGEKVPVSDRKKEVVLGFIDRI
ncbi:LytR/AlgR family response regulator transcription factor [Chitinophaga qingshengii]|uniref:Response regulator transcription factor n=1 Tax=Chitinophaga qingshengii TaxID=1569794 RepID=A0ABR7TLX7_9BACT|nr:LytTR family DNA-binding domain-containing protein [Chitinophaga qingshengii]MBC9930625.1 response regulator transcription factor [Chitinophaga qingshengii]